jgi:hypothetical protein
MLNFFARLQFLIQNRDKTRPIRYSTQDCEELRHAGRHRPKQTHPYVDREAPTLLLPKPVESQGLKSENGRYHERKDRRGNACLPWFSGRKILQGAGYGKEEQQD